MSRLHELPIFSMMWFVLYLLFEMFGAIRSDASANTFNGTNVFTGGFRMYEFKARGDDVTSCRVSNTRRMGGSLECVSLCLSDQWCAAVYTDLSPRVNNTDGVSMVCYLCMIAWDVSTLQSGNGSYAVAKVPPSGSAPPGIIGAVRDTIGLETNQVAAHYSCLSNGRKFSTTLNLDTWTWPVIPEGCQRQICNVESIANTVVRVVSLTDAPHQTRLYPVCADTDRPHGYVVCDNRNGVWTEYDLTRTLCLSTQCKKCNSLNRCVYAGTEKRTKNGHPCQSWSSQSPRIHIYTTAGFYKEDGGDITSAANFCRDLENSGYVWCYIDGAPFSMPRFEECDVPDCFP